MKCQPTKPATRPAFTPLGAFLREVLKADHEDTKALGAWEAEVSRVRKKHPVCPATVEDAGVDRRWEPSAERWLLEGIATGKRAKPGFESLTRVSAGCLADVRAKLDYILHYEPFSDGGCRKVAYRLRHDVPAWEAVCW